MKKNLFVGLFLVAVMAVVMFFPKGVLANEGIINLRGTGSGATGSCFAASVFVDGTYKIVMSCRELKIALSPEKNRYVAWIEAEGGKQKRLGEIVNGKMSTLTDVKFVRIFVTVEADGYGNTPSQDVILTGFVEPINFGPGITSTPIITPTPTPSSPTGKIVMPTEIVEETPGKSGLGTALTTIFKIALLGFGVLLLVVGVFSFLSRKRNL